jgi:nicotinate-nucleotide--dimethylbenzimidazole phosphoribosyltransferase
MAKTVNADVILADMGMFKKLDKSGILDYHIADGTADLSLGAAMTSEQCEKAIQYGIDIVRDAKANGYKLLATGEMGIGNTTTSSAIAAVLLGESVESVTGRGAGLSDEALDRKIAVIKRGIDVNAPNPADAFDVLRKLGGFDIAGLCGVYLGGAIYGIPIIIDGFISAVAALTALRLCPSSKQVMLASHISAEPAARMVLDALELTPVIHAGMRLGEGTGAVALIPLLDQIIAVYNELMTFADIGM